MLVLTRRRGEIIMVRDDIRIMVVELRDGKIRLGIEAPRETPIHRLEIYEAIQRERSQCQADSGERI